VTVAFSIDGGEPRWWTWATGPGQPVSSLEVEQTGWAEASRGTISWRGDHVRPGSATFEAGADGEAVVTVPIEVLSFPAAGPSDPTKVVLAARVVAEGRVAPGLRAQVRVGASGWGSDFDWDSARGEGTVQVTADQAPSWLLVHVGGSWVTPIASNPRDGLRLTLRRGGHVVVVTEVPLPRGLSLGVRRRDGRPLLAARELATDDEDADVLDADDEIDVGAVLGPFEPGDVSLVYSVGGVDVCTDVVRVEAGRLAVSRVRWDPARRD
jgi:hypothetical protein